MPATRHLIILSYDVTDDRDRQKLAAFLEERMTRVQQSLFEGWMTRRQAAILAKRAAALVDEGDSVRLYIVPRGGVKACMAWGFPPAPNGDGALII